MEGDLLSRLRAFEEFHPINARDSKLLTKQRR
jgi:hypothetical protein